MSPTEDSGRSSSAKEQRADRRPPRRARLRSPGEFWGRRTMLVGLALIVVAIIGGIALLADSGDGDGDESAAQRAVSERQSELTESLNDESTGILVKWPSEWEKLEKRGAFGFRSPDSKLVISISAPSAADGADALRERVIDEVRQEYGRSTVSRGSGSSFGGLEAAGATIQGPNSSTLVAVAPGEERAYLLQVVTQPDAPGETLVDGQLILGSLELSR